MYVCTAGFISGFPHSTLGSCFLEPLSETQLRTVWASVAATTFHYQKVGLDLSPDVFEWLRKIPGFFFSLFYFVPFFTGYGFGLGQCIKINKSEFNSSLQSTDVAGEV